VIYPAENAIKRLNEAAPRIKAAIIPDAGHDLTIVQARMVSTMATNFIKTLAP
jgi:hypothetical protein